MKSKGKVCGLKFTWDVELVKKDKIAVETALAYGAGIKVMTDVAVFKLIHGKTVVTKLFTKTDTHALHWIDSVSLPLEQIYFDLAGCGIEPYEELIMGLDESLSVALNKFADAHKLDIDQ